MMKVKQGGRLMMNLFSSPSSSFFTNYYNKTTLSSSILIKFYTSSKPQNPNHNHPLVDVNDDDDDDDDDDDVSSAELKTQIDKFYKGDYDAIPTIFESILKRKLSRKHEESDDELMNEFRQNQPSEVKNEEFDSLSSDTDSDSDDESVK